MEGEDARHRELPLPEGLGWDDIGYVIEGNRPRALFLDDEGFLYTPSRGDNQYNLLTGKCVDYHAGETKFHNYGNCHTNGYEACGFPANYPRIPGTFALPVVQCEHCHGPGMTMAEGNPAIRKDCHVHGPEIAVKASGGFIVS